MNNGRHVKSRRKSNKLLNLWNSLNKKRLLVVLAIVATLGFGVTSCVSKCNANFTEEEKTVQLLDSAGIVLDGDYNEADPSMCSFHFLDLKDGNLTDKDIERLYYYKNVGIITSVGSNVYETVDNIKEIVSNYNVNGPIMCNVNDIKTDEEVSAAIEFCKKLEANGCYVGFYGDKGKIASFKKKFKKLSDLDFEEYSVIVAGYSEDDKLPYKQNYVGYQIGEYIYQTTDFNDVISSVGLNKSDRFVEDYIYYVKSGDNLSMIAEKFGIDLNVLVSYNDMYYTQSDIYPGQAIKIPSLYNSEDEVLKEKVEESTEANTVENIGINSNVKRVIDISYFNDSINWEDLAQFCKEGKLDGVILRMNEAVDIYTNEPGFCLDPAFEYNLSQCNKYGIPYGTYSFSRAFTLEDGVIPGIKSEVSDIVNYVNNNLNRKKGNYDLTFKPSLPVYIDYLDIERFQKGQFNLLNYSSGEYNPEYAASLVNYWCEEIENQLGVYTGLYANKNEVQGNDTFMESLDRDMVKELWLACYGFDSRYKLGEHTLSASSKWELSQDVCSMYQVSERGYLYDEQANPVQETGSNTYDMNLCDPELFDRVAKYYGVKRR